MLIILFQIYLNGIINLKQRYTEHIKFDYDYKGKLLSWFDHIINI